MLAYASVAVAQRQPSASEVRRAQELVDRGDAFFDKKEYELAIAEYTLALVIAPHADLVWNIARAHEEMRRYTQAIAFYEGYKKMGVPEPDVTLAAEKIGALQTKLEKLKTGTLIVVVPSEDAELKVGKFPVQKKGLRRSVPLKPGRYRIRVELLGYVPFEKEVRVNGDATTTTTAVLVRAEKRAVLRVEVDVPDAMVSVDGGREVDAGVPIPLPGGAHKVRVTAGRRDPVERLVEAEAGQELTIKVQMGPERPPAEYPNWSAEYAVFAVGTRTPEGTALDGGRLTLTHAEGVDGELAVEHRRPLKKWRQANCGGQKALTWTETWDATLIVNSGRAALSLGQGRISACSCRLYCKASGSMELELLALPGKEGLIGDEVAILRTVLTDEATTPYRTAAAADVTGKWEVLQWGGSWRTDETLSLTGGGKTRLTGTLRRGHTGPIPSWKRRDCKVQSRFQQWSAYPVTAKPGRAVRVSPKTGRETECSCPGVCGNSPSLGEQTLRLLVFSRYLVGDGTLLRRAH